MQDTVRSVLLGQEGLFESSKGTFKGKQRVDLLKAIEGDSLESSLSILQFVVSCFHIAPHIGALPLF